MALTDDFNRTDLGSNWESVVGSAYSIVSNQLRGPAAYGDAAIRRTESSFPDDQYAQAKCEWGTGGEGGVAVRCGATGDCYFAFITGSDVALRKRSGGSTTFLAATSLSTTAGTPYTIKLEASSSTLTVRVAGTLHITHTDSSIASGRPGVYLNNGTPDGGVDYDDFESTDALSGGGGGGAVVAATALTHRGPRTVFTRHRLGNIASVTLSPAWLMVYSRSAGAPEIIARGQAKEGVTGLIKVPRAYDVEVGDILEDYFDGRLFYVLQIHFPGTDVRRRHCVVVEYLRPLADEFAYGVIDSYWLATSAGWAVEASSGELYQTNPSGTLPSAARLLYQGVAGDFDAWARVKCDGGSGGAIRRALIGARSAAGLGCYVGAKDNGTNTIPIRLDEHTASTVAETTGTGVASGSYLYVRLQRVGSGFQVFYNSSGTAPAAAADWTELPPSGSQFTSADSLRVGIAGYTQTGATGQARAQFLRNWSV